MLVPCNTQPSDLDVSSHANNISVSGHFRITLCIQLPYFLVPSSSPMKVFLHQHQIPQWFPLRHLCSAVTPVYFQFGGQWTALCLPLSYGSKKNLLIFHSVHLFTCQNRVATSKLPTGRSRDRCPFSLFLSGRAPWSLFNFHNL